MTLQQIREIRKISNKGITSINVKRQLAEYTKNNNLDSKEVVKVCRSEFTVDELLDMCE